MGRVITVGAAQSGPISRAESRSDAVERLLVQLREAHRRGCDLVVFTECALTPFFSHWWIEDETELDSWFETEMPGPSTQPLFDEARRLGIGFSLGFAELAIEDGIKRCFNSSVLVEKDGSIVGKFRKIHLPGHTEHRPDNPFQNLEKRYFELGNLGFQAWNAFGGGVGMCIYNDRRWPETWRSLALAGAELIILGYNTPDNIPEHPELNHQVAFHHELCLQSGAYQNSCWIVAVAKAGVEEGVSQLGLTSIVSPTGQIVAQTSTLHDELVVYSCDLDLCAHYRKEMFNFPANRHVEHYSRITEQTDAVPPP
ncbi:MAG: putative amidohydrolase [Planctomycetaceae bacterium]|jgi:predicted amidohydrolase